MKNKRKKKEGSLKMDKNSKHKELLKKEKRFNLIEKRQKLRKDIDYLFSKIDWRDSFMDAKAITIMNNFYIIKSYFNRIYFPFKIII